MNIILDDDYERLSDALRALDKTLDQIGKRKTKKYHDDQIDSLVDAYKYLNEYCKDHIGVDLVHCNDNKCIFCKENNEKICEHYDCMIHNMQYNNLKINKEKQ